MTLSGTHTVGTGSFTIESNAAVEHLANLTFIVCSASVNFICRKFLVFSK